MIKLPEFKLSNPRRQLLLTPQLSLDLHARKHGGARPGAGRPRKKDADRKTMAHRARASHRKGDPVHVTLRVTKRTPSLRSEVLGRIVKDALLKQRKKLAAEGSTHFQVVHFTIQHDHLHLIVEAPDKQGIARGVAGLEIRIARAINELLRRKGRLWSDRYHRRDLRTPTDTRNVLRYVLLNVQKHHLVFGDRAFADPCSSASTFDGFVRPVVVVDDAPTWPRVAPRTWLLATAWRARGLIDPAAAPPSFPHRERS